MAERIKIPVLTQQFFQSQISQLHERITKCSYSDLNTGTITFTNDEKEIMVTAPVQVVGTYDTEDSTWLWGWDHPSVSESLGEYARRVHDFGEQYGKETLTTRKIAASMDDAWEFTALACYLGDGQGGYRGVSGSTCVFMVYGPVTLNKKD